MWLLFCCFGPLGFPWSKVIVLSDLRFSNRKHQLRRRGKSSKQTTQKRTVVLTSLPSYWKFLNPFLAIAIWEKHKHSQKYCGWTKSCTTKDDDYPIIYRVLTIPGGAGFCPSTVSPISSVDWLKGFPKLQGAICGGSQGVQVICVGMLPPRMPGMPPFAAYIFGQDPKLNLYFFPAAHTWNKFQAKKNTFFCSLLTWNSLKCLQTHTMFQEVEVWRGGEKPEAAFLVALESLENHSCGKKRHHFSNGWTLGFMLRFTPPRLSVRPTPPPTKVTMKKMK